mmetsp:Transcript_53509/g.128272  ORF Transcript_53509/g.128272 Transcript_53509/m.128272 type:complete len:238 (+) Transcript_53509:48-761(+)
MLSARKVELLAGLKVRGLELRNRELDFYMIRFTMTAGLSSIMTCLSYVGLIKIKIPEPMHEGFYWQVATFYVCTSLSMVLSLYNLVLTSFSMVQGQGLALRGPPGSLAKAVGIFQEQWRIVRVVLVASLLAIVTAGGSISWMKLDGMVACIEETGEECPCKADSPVECFARRFWRPVIVSIIVTTLVIAMFRKVREMQLQLRILSEDLVRGDLLVRNESGTARDMMAENSERIEARR